MEDLRLLIDLHKTAARQGPGGEAETRKAIEFALLDRSRRLRVADIGCGTGASALLLAEELDAHITAVDFLPEFLEVLERNASARGLADSIIPLACSMDALPFREQEYDVLWSEGAVYNVGFEAGISQWKRFLKPGGMLIISELTWFRAVRPAELEAYWTQEYPEVDTAASKLGILERHGYAPVAYFALPKYCWTAQYYQPMQDRFADFLVRNGHSEEARAIVAAEEREIALYAKYADYYGYGVYIARLVDAQPVSP